jgi:hypothetical protein
MLEFLHDCCLDILLALHFLFLHSVLIREERYSASLLAFAGGFTFSAFDVDLLVIFSSQSEIFRCACGHDDTTLRTYTYETSAFEALRHERRNDRGNDLHVRKYRTGSGVLLFASSSRNLRFAFAFAFAF